MNDTMATAGSKSGRAATYADLEAYVLRDGQYVLHETFDGVDEVKAPPFDAVPFPITALWPLDPAPAQA